MKPRYINDSTVIKADWKILGGYSHIKVMGMLIICFTRLLIGCEKIENYAAFFGQIVWKKRALMWQNGQFFYIY